MLPIDNKFYFSDLFIFYFKDRSLDQSSLKLNYTLLQEEINNVIVMAQLTLQPFSEVHTVDITYPLSEFSRMIDPANGEI